VVSTPSAPPTLPDLLRPGLELVFVGINPGEASARSGHYYAHPGNRFWAALSASGLVPRAVSPHDDTWLGEACGIGFTDVVKRVVTDSTQVTTTEARAALPAFTARIAAAQPRALCFTAGRACDEVFPGVRGASVWGRLPVTLPGAEVCQVWVMPSTSGLAVRWRAEGDRVLRDLAASLGRAHETAGAAS
jgi:TDG/mug DNA glycosylase family protein